MYQIIEGNDGKYYCSCVIQDGTERWEETNLEKAIDSMVIAARVLNHSLIRREDVKIIKNLEPPQNITITQEEYQLLQSIKRGTKKVLNFDNYLLKYNPSEKECEIIQQIREGSIKI